MYDQQLLYYYEALKPQFFTYVKASIDHRGVIAHQQLRDAAMQSAGSLFHFRENLNLALDKPLTRDNIGNEISDYNLIGDVFNASKHAKLTQRVGKRLINGASDIIEGSIMTKFRDHDGEFTNYQAVIFINQNNGERRDLLSIATNTYNYWTKFITDLGIINNPAYYHYPGDDVLTRSQANINVQTLQATVGIRRKSFTIVGRAYDYINNSFTYEKDNSTNPTLTTFQKLTRPRK